MAIRIPLGMCVVIVRRKRRTDSHVGLRPPATAALPPSPFRGMTVVDGSGLRRFVVLPQRTMLKTALKT